MNRASRIPSTVGDNNIRYGKLGACPLQASASRVGPAAGGPSSFGERQPRGGING